VCCSLCTESVPRALEPVGSCSVSPHYTHRIGLDAVYGPFVAICAEHQTSVTVRAVHVHTGSVRAAGWMPPQCLLARVGLGP